MPGREKYEFCSSSTSLASLFYQTIGKTAISPKYCYFTKNHTYKNKKGEECQMNINAIPNNMEKYMAFMLGNHLTFIDSFQFMSSSLDKLVGNLPDESFKYTKETFKNEFFQLMEQKGVYPYDYMDSFDKFNETELPKKKDFYSILNNEHITNDQYIQSCSTCVK